MEAKIHVGNMVSTRIDAMGVKRTVLGVKMGLPHTAVYAYEKRSSLHTRSLLQLSHALRHNFFMDIALQLPADYAMDKENPQEKLLAEQAEQIKRMQWEIELLKDLIKGKG